MTRTMGMIDARKRLTLLPEELAKISELGAVAVTRRGKPGLALLETLEVMGDPDLMKALRSGMRDAESGRLTTAEEVKRELGL